MTVTLVDPTGDVSSSGVTLTGGATVTAVTADASTATYATGNVDLATAKVNVGTVAIGATRIRSVQIRVGAQQSGSKAARTNVRLVDPNNLALAPAGATDISSSLTATTYQASQATAGPGGQAWSQSLLDRIQVEVVWYRAGSPFGLLFGFQRVLKLQVAVETNTRPVVTVPTITGGPTTSRPGWTGTYSDADADPQTRAQVKVFTQPQTLAVGFSADTTTPLWDSGSLAGAVTSGQVGTDLFAGPNYVLFWRGGQAWPDSTGVWWSAWAASAPFASSVSPPPAPTVVPTPRPDVPAVGVVLTVTAPMDGTLTAAAASVERGDRFDSARGPVANWAPAQVASGGTTELSTAGWAATAGADGIAHEPVTVAWPDIVGAAGCIHWQPRSGTVAYLQPGGGADPVDSPGQYKFAVVGGAEHTLSMWCWAGAPFSTKAAVTFLDGDLTPIGSVSIGPGESITTAPRPVVYTVTAPADAVFAYGGLQNTASVSTGDVWMSRVGWGLGPFPVGAAPGTAGPLVWTAVRQHGAGDVLNPAAGTVTVPILDRECPPGRPVIYRTRTIGDLSGSPVTSDWSTYATTLLPCPTQAVLKDPATPDLVTAVNELDGHERQQDEDATEFHIAGDDGNTTVLRDWIGGLDGKLSLFADSFPALRRLRAVYPTGRTLLLQHPEGGQTYLRFTSRQEQPKLMATGLHAVDLNYVECTRP